MPQVSCKTLLFHGGDTGSIPVRDAKLADSQSSKSTWVFGLVEQKTHCHLRLYLDSAGSKRHQTLGEYSCRSYRVGIR